MHRKGNATCFSCAHASQGAENENEIDVAVENGNETCDVVENANEIETGGVVGNETVTCLSCRGVICSA